jgi:excisionase family DNA binding protein
LSEASPRLVGPRGDRGFAPPGLDPPVPLIPGQMSLPLSAPSARSEGSSGASGTVEPAARTEMFDKQNLARYFGVSVDTIERLVKAGDLPAVRIGGQVRFTLEDVDGFIHKHRIKERTA